jgi:antitoxin VapB
MRNRALHRRVKASRVQQIVYTSLASCRVFQPMAERKRVKLFRHGRDQAILVPFEFQLPGHEVSMRRDGDRLIIEPIRKRGLIALLKTMKPLKKDFPEIDDPVRRSCGKSTCRR